MRESAEGERMPKKDSTLMAISLDRSGSMKSVKDEVIGGFNKLLEEHKKLPGECLITLVQFDDQYELLCNAKNIQEVAPLSSETYVPRGWTRLYDAIGKTIDDVGVALAALPDDQRPEKVLVIVLTDGAENSSKEYTGERVREMIAHQRDRYQWEFAFHGCDESGLKQARNLGYPAQNVVRGAAGGAQLQSVSSRSLSYRSGRGYN
jgi:hypothetical protein